MIGDHLLIHAAEEFFRTPLLMHACLSKLTAANASTLAGLAAQAEVLAHLIGADDPNPDPQQLLARRIRDAARALQKKLVETSLRD